MPKKRYSYVVVGAALAGAGIVALTPTSPALPTVHVPAIQLLSGDTS